MEAGGVFDMHRATHATVDAAKVGSLRADLESARSAVLRWWREAGPHPQDHPPTVPDTDSSDPHQLYSAVMAAEAEALHWRKVAGQTSCRRHGTGPTGGFCMSPHRQQDKRLMNYCLPKTLAASLAGLFANQSVLDLGCGLGQYGRYFRAYAPSVRWQGLDGAENVQEATGGLVQFADLSEGLPRQHQQWYDWKLSIEVAEHLPRHMEPTFMFNLASKVKHGVVISWARLGQHGNAHVNCQSDAYVRCAFQLFGLSADETLTQALRATIDPIWRGEVTLAKGCMWLAHTLMAFRVRNESRVDSWRAHSPLARYLSHRAPHHVGVSQTFVDHYLQETAMRCPLVNSSNRCDPKFYQTSNARGTPGRMST